MYVVVMILLIKRPIVQHKNNDNAYGLTEFQLHAYKYTVCVAISFERFLFASLILIKGGE
jgi:hypothetical protein